MKGTEEGEESRYGEERKDGGGKDEIIRHSVENGIIKGISNQWHFT